MNTSLVFYRGARLLIVATLEVLIVTAILHGSLIAMTKLIHSSIKAAFEGDECLGDVIKSRYAAISRQQQEDERSTRSWNEIDKPANIREEIFNRIVSENWCNRSPGRLGDSIKGRLQFLAAATANRQLRTILRHWLNFCEIPVIRRM